MRSSNTFRFGTRQTKTPIWSYLFNRATTSLFMDRWTKTNFITAKPSTVERVLCHPTTSNGYPTICYYRTPREHRVPLLRYRSKIRIRSKWRLRTHTIRIIRTTHTTTHRKLLQTTLLGLQVRLSPSMCLLIMYKLLTILRSIRDPVCRRFRTRCALIRQWTSRKLRCRRCVLQTNQEVGYFFAKKISVLILTFHFCHIY